MSAVELLSKFRYAPSSRECPMALIRSVDTTQLKSAVDLQQMKHITSAISDCAMPTAQALQLLTPNEVSQLLAVLQASLQFALYSQTVLKDQIVLKQNGIQVQQVTLQQMQQLETKLELCKKKLDEAAVEKTAIQSQLHALDRQCVELRTANTLLERELEFHRGTQRLMTAAASAGNHAASSKSAAPAATEVEVPAKHASSTSRRRDVETADSDATTYSDSSHHVPGRGGPRQKERGSSRKARQDSGFVDWATFSTFMMQQQQQAHRVEMYPPLPPHAYYAPTQPLPASPTVAPPAQHAPQPQDQTALLINALRNDLKENQQEILKQTQSSVAAVEQTLASRIQRVQDEQRHHHEELAAQVAFTDKKFSDTLTAVSREVGALKDETEQQIRLLKLDYSNTVVSSASRQTSVAQQPASSAPPQLSPSTYVIPPLPTSQQVPPPQQASQAPAATVVSTSNAVNTSGRSMSPNVLPPLPLSQVQQDLSARNAGTHLHSAASPVGTPSSNVFGPKVVSANVSNADNSSDDDDDPYVPMSKQNIEEPCQHCRQRMPIADVRTHEAVCELRMVACPSCKQSIVARLLPNHKCSVTPLSPTAEESPNPSQAPQGGKASGALDTSLNTSQSHLVRKASSQMLKDTQDELQRLLDEEAADEAKKAGR